MAIHITSLTALAKKIWFKDVLESLLQQGYTKAKIAESLGIAPQRLTNISNGTFAISDKMMDTITATFNLGTIIISTEAYPNSDNNHKEHSDQKRTEKIIDRLDTYLLLYGISDSQLTTSAKLNSDTLLNIRKNGLDLDDKQIKKILEVLPDMNEEWLKTGAGAMKNGNSIPIIEKKGPLARILQLLEEEGISLDEFARSVNSSATLFDNAVKWPYDSRNLVLGNDRAIRGWVNAFCDVFPKYSKFWILTGKTSKYNFPVSPDSRF